MYANAIVLKSVSVQVIQLHFALKTLNMYPLLIAFMTFASQKEKQKCQ